MLLNWSILLMTALCKKVFDAVAFTIVKKNLTSSSPIALKDKQTLFIPWIMNSRYLWKTRITSYFVFPTCSINQICLCIEIGMESVEIDFTADFNVHLPSQTLTSPSLLKSRDIELRTAWNYLVDLLLKIGKFVALHLECTWLLPENYTKYFVFC